MEEGEPGTPKPSSPSDPSLSFEPVPPDSPLSLFSGFDAVTVPKRLSRSIGECPEIFTGADVNTRIGGICGLAARRLRTTTSFDACGEKYCGDATAGPWLAAPRRAHWFCS